MIRTLQQRSEGAFDLPEGTVYPALHRLEDDGLLHSYWAEQEGRRRRLYEITADGATALSEMRREWRRFANGVQAVVGGRHEGRPHRTLPRPAPRPAARLGA